MSSTEKYQLAWDSYINSCRKYGIEAQISFIDFVRSITEEQAEQMISNMK